jgi:hypothetical protein
MDSTTLGPAERILNTVLAFSDHMVHNRPGIVATTPGPTGVTWKPVIYKEEDGKKVVYERQKRGKKGGVLVKIGELWADNTIRLDRHKIGEYRAAGVYPEVATWLYRQAADVWKMDNEFGAHWASYAYHEDRRDLKVVLAAFMLVQNRKGDSVKVDDTALRDDDYRDVGEAMCLLSSKKDDKSLSPKLLLRVKEVLCTPGVAAINRELGFGSGHKPFLGRWPKVVEKWLLYREQNPKLLEGLVKAGFRRTVMDLARAVGYKPSTPRFFELLRWKQNQAKDGRRQLAIGVAVTKAETWEGLSEEDICKRIVASKYDMKRVVGMVPKEVGLTKAVVSAVIESGGMSNKDLVIYSPTLEELGLLEDKDVKARWEKALKAAEDMRAANIASRMKTTAAKEKLEEAADEAVKKAVAEEMKSMRLYVIVDISGSMSESIELAKDYLRKFVQAFPPDKVHVAVFNTVGRRVNIKLPTAAAVEMAFRGFTASGGTNYGAGVLALSDSKPTENEDSLMIFVGDEGQYHPFDDCVSTSGLRPRAFGLIKVPGENGSAVRDTAARLQIPCFQIDQRTFGDVYAIPQTLRSLIAATPVGKLATSLQPAIRVSLVDKIIKTPLLQKPAWA